jgi:hypothetical protein
VSEASKNADSDCQVSIINVSMTRIQRLRGIREAGRLVAGFVSCI